MLSEKLPVAWQTYTEATPTKPSAQTAVQFSSMKLAMQPEVFKLLSLMLPASHVAEVVVMFALVWRAQDGMEPEKLPLASHVCTASKPT